MRITIHRGTHQIGGCVTEYEYGGWRLFVDYGEELPGAPHAGDLRIEGLTHGDISRSALLITHYHSDHIGRITQLPKDLPIYMGKVSRDIQLELSNHLKSLSLKHQEMVERLQTVKTFEAGHPIVEFGRFKIMPVTVDHSAFDAYAFKIEADQVSAFHTGDFRTHGFRSGVLPKVIKKFVGKVNYVVCEATNISRRYATNKPEYELQKEFVDLFRENKNNVVYVSSSNIDRLFGLYQAAIKTDRVFIIDEYQKRIMDVVAERDPIWGKSRLYKFKKGQEPFVLSISNRMFWMNDKFKRLLDHRGYVLIARANDRFDDFISNIPGEKQTYLSMWEGYVREGADTYQEALARAVGKDYIYKHTSGHCDMNSLRDFFRMLHPMAVIPIHTDDPEEFAQMFGDEWPVVLLNDGESVAPISSRKVDPYSACIYCVKEAKGHTDVTDDGDNARCWALDDKFLGDFACHEDAYSVISHVRYRPEALLGYEIETEDDMWPSEIKVYDPQLNIMAEYHEGKHSPGEEKYQEPCRFKAGEKALAVFYAGYNAVIPVTVIGPLDPDYWHKLYNKEEMIHDFFSTYESFQESLLDWDWDSVMVHPLVRFDEMSETEIVPRVRLFPYSDFKEKAD